jgi:hypothetical protein
MLPDSVLRLAEIKCEQGRIFFVVKAGTIWARQGYVDEFRVKKNANTDRFKSLFFLD